LLRFRPTLRRLLAITPKLLVSLTGAGLFAVLLAGPAQATSGQINNVMNMQGRLLTNSGAVVADGTYNIEFKIYKNGDGLSASNATGSPSSSLLWTEDWLVHNTQGVTVKNGYFSVQLGTVTSLPSAVNLDESVLWLSMNIASGANATANCNPFSSCTPDGELLPMKSLAAAPYAMNAANANALGGIAASGFIQNSASSQQTASFDIVAGAAGNAGGQIQAASSGTAPVLVLKNGSSSSGNLLELQP
jgi:hypothetical protein